MKKKQRFFEQEFEKNDLKKAIPTSFLTILLENLYKGTSQECKKID